MLGKYYLQEATGTVDAVTALSCVDMIGVLDTVEYKGGIYEKMPVSDLIADILEDENVEFELDEAFDGVTLTGYLAIGSKRTALQQIAFAIGAVVDTARTEIVRFYPAPVDVTKVITPARKVVGHKITMEALVTQVDVTAHQYTLITDEVKELNKATFEVGEHMVTFSSPVSVTSVSGATIVEKHPNYCIVNVTKAGEVILSGYGYEDTKTVYTVKTEPLPAGAKASAKSVTSATLRAHADWLYPARCDRLVRRRSGNHYAERTVTHEYYRHAYHGPHPGRLLQHYRPQSCRAGHAVRCRTAACLRL